MQLPIIHSKGTPRADLYRDYHAAARALKGFKQQWATIEFNARDYRCGSTDVFNDAADERSQISWKIRDISRYLNALVEHLDL